MSKAADRTCNQSEIYSRCDKIFGGNCKSKCVGKEGDCRGLCESRYPPKPYPCNCSTDSNGNTSCSTCFDYSERNACYSRCKTKVTECQDQNCTKKYSDCTKAYSKCKSAEKACRYPNPVTGDCSCPAAGGPIKEVKKQITWNISNKACDYGFYGDSGRFQARLVISVNGQDKGQGVLVFM